MGRCPHNICSDWLVCIQYSNWVVSTQHLFWLVGVQALLSNSLNFTNAWKILEKNVIFSRTVSLKRRNRLPIFFRVELQGEIKKPQEYCSITFLSPSYEKKLWTQCLIMRLVYYHNFSTPCQCDSMSHYHPWTMQVKEKDKVPELLSEWAPYSSLAGLLSANDHRPQALRHGKWHITDAFCNLYRT